MPSSKKQRASQRAGLKKLRTLGLYKGKIPRGEPSPSQKRTLKSFDDVVKGRAAVVAPKNPASYGKLFRRKGGKVIVPKGKGEKISVNKKGNIQRTRRGPLGEKIIGTFRRAMPDNIPPEPKPVKAKRYQWAIPFARRIGKGKYKLQIMRFPTYEALQRFMVDYPRRSPPQYVDWPNYVIQEEISDLPKKERDAKIQAALISVGRAKPEHFVGTSELQTSQPFSSSCFSVGEI